MPRRRFHLVLLFLAGFATAALLRRRPEAEADASPLSEPWAWDAEQLSSPGAEPGPEPRVARPRLRHRLALAGLVVCFFAGAALAATAGGRVAELMDEPAAVPAETAAAETTAQETTAVDTTEAEPAEPVSDETVAAEPAPEPAAPAETADSEPAPAEPAPAPDETEADDAEAAHGVWAPAAPAPAPAPVPAVNTKPRPKPTAAIAHPAAPAPAAVPAPAPQPDPETDAPGTSPVIWVNVALPDPIPPSARLSPRFAKRLQATARRHHVGWALLLGTFRAEGSSGSLDALAVRLSTTSGKPWTRVLATAGKTAVADRAIALARYNRVVGLAALVEGLDTAQQRIERRLLGDERLLLTEAGRGDLEAGRIDVRVLIVIGYLVESFGEVTVSSLETGHRLYARPGVISAHVYGRAVDVAALGGVPIAGHQEPGGLTEDAVRALLLLPPEVRPLQVISLLGLGGPSFPLADHADHIHVGF